MEPSGIIKILKDHPSYQQVVDTLYWKDLTVSGLYFSIGNMLFFLVTLGDYTLLSLLSYLLVVQLSIGLLYKTYTQVRGQPDPFESIETTVYSVPSGERLQKTVRTITALLQFGIIALKRALTEQDVTYTAKVAFALFQFAIISNFLSGGAFLYFVFLIAFGFPRLYQDKKTEIHALLDKLPPQVTALWKEKQE